MSDNKVQINVDVDNKEIGDQDLSDYLGGLYDVTKITDEELKLWNDAYSYKGFNRKNVIKDLMKKVPDLKVAQQIILICGLLGPQRAAQVKLIGGRTVASYGIPASGLKGNSGASCQRITAATADLCAFLLKKIGIPKRLNLPCPAWLQFPSAGSIKLPTELRNMHIEFSRRFSTAIGGIFNEQIYEQMMTNAYLDPKLNLFDDTIIADIQQSAPSISVPQPAPTLSQVQVSTTQRQGNSNRGRNQPNQ